MDIMFKLFFFPNHDLDEIWVSHPSLTPLSQPKDVKLTAYWSASIRQPSGSGPRWAHPSESAHRLVGVRSASLWCATPPVAPSVLPALIVGVSLSFSVRVSAWTHAHAPTVRRTLDVWQKIKVSSRFELQTPFEPSNCGCCAAQREEERAIVWSAWKQTYRSFAGLLQPRRSSVCRPHWHAGGSRGAEVVDKLRLRSCKFSSVIWEELRERRKKMKSTSQDQSLSDSRELDRSYDPLTGRDFM